MAPCDRVRFLSLALAASLGCSSESSAPPGNGAAGASAGQAGATGLGGAGESGAAGGLGGNAGSSGGSAGVAGGGAAGDLGGKAGMAGSSSGGAGAAGSAGAAVCEGPSLGCPTSGCCVMPGVTLVVDAGKGCVVEKSSDGYCLPSLGTDCTATAASYCYSKAVTGGTAYLLATGQAKAAWATAAGWVEEGPPVADSPCWKAMALPGCGM